MHRSVSSLVRHWLFAGLLAAVSSFAIAEAPQQKTQVPGYYRLMLGSFEVTALYDGAIDLDEKLLKSIAKRDIQRLLARQFLKGPKVQTAVNAYLVNTGSKLVLVDAGAAKLFGPGLGNIIDNLKAAGYTPEQVDTVLITHLHGDHINGLVTPDGKAVFTNAEVWSAKADNEFWLSEEIAAKAPKDFQAFFKMSPSTATANCWPASPASTLTATRRATPATCSGVATRACLFSATSCITTLFSLPARKSPLNTTTTQNRLSPPASASFSRPPRKS